LRPARAVAAIERHHVTRRFAALRKTRYFRCMTEAGNDSVTRLLQRWSDGDAAALDRLLPLVYADLRRIAASALRAAPGHSTLQTTALVHDVLLRLLGHAPATFENGAHLLNASARMMRQVLIDRARKAQTEKRGGRWLRDDFTEALELPIPDGTDLAALDRALNELESVHERMAKVVELRYFVGLEVTEVAATLGITERTARRDWVAAREWLRDRLEQPA
jgi:RNA polymerase sigma factor (TIGR02999 family)